MGISDALVQERFDREVLARPEAIAPLRTAVWRLAVGFGVSERVGNAVRVAVSEALTNVVVHAYAGRDPGSVTVQAWVNQDEDLIVRVLDDGHGLIPRPDSPGLGRGMGLMAQMADGFAVSNRDGTPGTTVSLRFVLSGS